MKSVMLMVVLTGCFGADVLADAMAVLVGCLVWCFDRFFDGVLTAVNG